MTDLPPDAVEAAAQAFSVVRGTIDERATAALLAAQPAWEAWLREKVAREINRAKPSHFTRDYTPVDQAWDQAAKVAREGGTP